MFISVAYAQAAGAAQPGIFETVVIPMLAMFAIFYFLLIRPQSKRFKKHQEFVANLKRGDQVITQSGIYGKIEGITDKFVTLEVSDGVSIRILRGQIASSAQEEVKNG